MAGDKDPIKQSSMGSVCKDLLTSGALQTDSTESQSEARKSPAERAFKSRRGELELRQMAARHRCVRHGQMKGARAEQFSSVCGVRTAGSRT